MIIFSWRASNYSFLWGLTLDEGITYRLGTLEPAEMVSRMSEVKLEYESPLPERFDAREKWPGLIEKVMDQGHCGSSWAFSTTGMTSQLDKTASKFWFLTDLLGLSSKSSSLEL